MRPRTEPPRPVADALHDYGPTKSVGPDYPCYNQEFSLSRHFTLCHQSRISTIAFLPCFVAAALTTVRRACAMRPCFPITLPMSSVLTLSCRITERSPSIASTSTSSGLSTSAFARYSSSSCLLYTSDAADDLLCVDLGGR